MNRKSGPLMFALTGALALAAMGCSNAGDQQQGPPNAATAQTPPSPAPTAMPPETGATMSQPVPGGTMGQPATGESPSFDEVAGSKGYIAQEDAQRIPWLAQHFSQCDSDGDGRITQPEYSRCQQEAGQGSMQPPQGGSTSG